MSVTTKVKTEQKAILYTVIYFENGVKKEIGCSKYSLDLYKKTLASEGATNITAIPRELPKYRKLLDEDIIEIRKYYYSKYTCYYRKLKLNQISKRTFNKIVKMLKNLKATCKNKSEFEIKFDEYKKSLTVIG